MATGSMTTQTEGCVHQARPPSHPPPSADHAVPLPRKRKRKFAIAITATVAITAGAVTFTLTRGTSSEASSGVSVQANVDLNQAITELPKLGFAGRVSRDGATDSSQNCSQASTGDVKKFLTKNPCKEYSVTLIKLHEQEIYSQAVISWVVMPTPSLTVRYKSIVDKRYKGNPPGQSSVFNGLCYASGKNENAAWVAQVQPTGHVTLDRQILQAVAPVKLSRTYFETHCVG